MPRFVEIVCLLAVLGLALILTEHVLGAVKGKLA